MAIDQVWEICNGRHQTAWMELIVASRTDAYLREAIIGANDRSVKLIDESFRELFPRPDTAGTEYDLIPAIVLMLLSAMSLQVHVLSPELVAGVLTVLKTFKL